MNLKKQFNLIFFSSLLIILIAIFVFYLNIYMPLKSKNEMYFENTILQLKSNLDLAVKNIFQIGNTISNNEVVQEFLTTKDMPIKIKLNNTVEKLVTATIAFNDDVVNISIFDMQNNGNVFYSSENFSEYRSFQQIYQKYKKGELPSNGIVSVPCIDNDNKFYYCHIKPIYEIGSKFVAKSQIGIMFVFYRNAGINKSINELQLSKGSNFSVVDENSVVMASNLSEQIGKKIEILEDKYAIRKIEGTSWELVNNNTQSEYSSDLNFLAVFVVLILFLIVLLVGLLYLLTHRRVLKPLQNVIDAISKIGDGTSKKRLDVKVKNEISIIVSSTNSMLDRMDEVKRNIFTTQEKLYEMELLKNKSRFLALQSQINPHFLYNTLECMRSIGIAYKSSEIADISTALADIFRYSIKGGEYVLVRQEIDIVKEYLKIMNIRFNNKFNVEIDIDDEVYTKKILKMILQPIVENSIYHGMEKIEEEGFLTIYGRIIKDKIIFKISDNGFGIEEQKLIEIKESLLDKSNMENNSVGISNVNNRIKITHSDEYGLAIDSVYGKGCVVTITLPIL